jgi:UDP-N-acetyl-D-glucosamine dehydrogenase
LRRRLLPRLLARARGPGQRDFNTKNIPKVVGGIDAGRARGEALYGSIVDHVVPVSSPEVAESAKLLENIFRAVNIALVNEMKVVFDRMGIDVWEVIEAAKTKPFGFMPFYPGPGPRRPLHPARSVLSDVEGGGVRHLGALHRAGRRDQHVDAAVRRRPEMLQERGAVVAYCDPFVPHARRGRKHDLGLSTVPCTAEEFAGYDLILVSTPHAAFKDAALYSRAKLVVDTRNIVPEGAGPVVVRA